MATTPLGGFPFSVFVLDALLCIAVVGASRFGERALFRARSTLRERDARRTLIVGAGRSGRSLLRELRETPGERVVGFVDDDPRLHRRRLLGVPVRGGTLDIDRILDAARPDTVLVTIPRGPAPSASTPSCVPAPPSMSPAGSSGARPTSTPSPCSAPRRVTHDGGRAAATQLPAADERTWADRLTNAVPVVVAFLWLCVLYGWQTRGHVTPWLFTDELKYTQIARSIAETGRASERHHSVAFDTLYTYVDRAVLADPRRPHCLLGDQVLRRDRDDGGDLPDLPARAHGGLAVLGALRRDRGGRGAISRVWVVRDRGAARLSRRRTLVPS